jgi:fructose-specific phosphotransferase system IIA component
MKLVEMLHADAITVELKAGDKEEVLAEMVDLLVAAGGIKKADKEQILKKLKEREALGSTGIGKGVGIPHAKCPSVKKMVAALAISKGGVDFKSLDGELTYILFLLIAPGETPGPHLKALAKISRLLDDKFVRDRLRSAKSGAHILKTIEEEEDKKAF